MRILRASVLGLLFVLAPAAMAEVSRTEIEESITCQCGCGLTVHACPHLNCGSGIPLKKEIASLVVEGKGRDEILVHFRTKYGEKILSSPVAEGFNLAAWILPFALIAGGGIAVIVVVRRWTDHGKAAPPASDDLPEADRRRLEEELRRDA